MTTIMTTILAATFLMSAGTTFAQDADSDPGHSGPRAHRGMQGMPMVEHLKRALHRLDLSDEQKESIRTILQDMKAELGPIMAEMKAGHMHLMELIKSAEYDEDAVAELATKEGKLVAQRMIMAGRALAEVYSYLTDEQRVQLDEMAAQRMQHRGAKHKRRFREG